MKIIPSGIEPVTFRLVEQAFCVRQFTIIMETHVKVSPSHGFMIRSLTSHQLLMTKAFAKRDYKVLSDRTQSSHVNI